jgi:Cu2+-exporting ATPase
MTMHDHSGHQGHKTPNSSAMMHDHATLGHPGAASGQDPHVVVRHGLHGGMTDAGHNAHAGMDHDEHTAHGEHMVNDMLRRFVISLVLSIPLVLYSPIGETHGEQQLAPP